MHVLVAAVATHPPRKLKSALDTCDMCQITLFSGFQCLLIFFSSVSFLWLYQRLFVPYPCMNDDPPLNVDFELLCLSSPFHGASVRMTAKTYEIWEQIEHKSDRVVHQPLSIAPTAGQVPGMEVP